MLDSADSAAQQFADRAFGHIQHLTGEIGAWPSTGVGEREAARYAAHMLLHASLREVRLESFDSPRSTPIP